MRKCPDHPRSRGVYVTASMPAEVMPGSSPLARGLRGATPPLSTGSTDHPRSRGVYCSSSHCRSIAQGSSPLARGLLTHRHHTLAPQRIIPARAGFTRRPPPPQPPSPDHPRSRGVYMTPTTLAETSRGSSPLARGLRGGGVDRAAHRRIIPARAGFTPSPPSSATSSAWIIPARAGFTARGRRPGGRRRDHPRSRGVYGACGRPLSPGQGSSPLARGLRPVRPARA